MEMEEMGKGNLRSEKTPESIDGSTEVVFSAEGSQTDEDLFIKVKDGRSA